MSALKNIKDDSSFALNISILIFPTFAGKAKVERSGKAKQVVEEVKIPCYCRKIHSIVFPQL